MKTSHVRKIVFTTLGLGSSVLLNLNTPGFAQAIIPLPSLSTTTNSSTSTPRVKAKNNNLQWVDSVAERVIRANGLDDHPWRFQISDEYDINAYAGELNKIVIYKGLLDQIHGDDAALAFIISHELAHRTQRHFAQQEEAETSLKEKLLKQAEAEYNNWIVQSRRKSKTPIYSATDELHSKDEERFFCIGKTPQGILTVRFTLRQQSVRIIGAGKWRKWRKYYEEVRQL